MPLFSPEQLPWVSWCYGSHPSLWELDLESGIHQGDPLGPLLFSLVLQKLLSSIEADDDCFDLLFQARYLDNRVLAGNSVLRAIHLIEELGPGLGLHINLANCEHFSSKGNTSFPPAPARAWHISGHDFSECTIPIPWHPFRYC